MALGKFERNIGRRRSQSHGNSWPITWSFVLAVTLCAFATPGLAAEPAAGGARHALLIGVNDYPKLPERLQLEGPHNDITLMRDVLVDLGFEPQKVTVLTTGKPRDGLPTRAGILGALDDLSARVVKGDLVYLHFAGHGSQQLDDTDDDIEPDGLDELFLPMDVGGWDGGIGGVENAVTDDDIRQKIDGLRARGALVWAVFDSCNAGTMLRAGDIGERFRRVLPQDLGMPESVLAAAAGTESTLALDGKSFAVEREATPAAVGGYVAFYATQPHELTPEMPLPVGAGDRRTHGLFTFTLAKVLSRSPNVTYRQAAQQILHEYRAAYRSETPMFEGDLDRAVLGGPVERVHQWRVMRHGASYLIPAGQLHGLVETTVLALLPEPKSGLEEAVGYAEVVTAETVRSRIKPISYAGKETMPKQLREGLVARIVDRRLIRRLAIALPGRGPDASRSSTQDMAWRAIEAMRVEPPEGLRVDWVSRDADADLRLWIDGSRLWLLPPAGELVRSGPARTPSLDLDVTWPVMKERLAEMIDRVARGLSLLRLSRDLASSEYSKVLNVELAVCRAKNTLAQRSCIAGRIEPNKYSPQDSPIFKDGDHVEVRVTNTGRRAIDVSILFIDSRFGIHPLFPAAGESNRLRPSETLPIKLTINADTIGREQLLLLAVPGVGENADFSFLAQRGVVTRGDSSEPWQGATVSQLLEQAGSRRGALRGANRSPPEQVGAYLFAWTTAP